MHCALAQKSRMSWRVKTLHVHVGDMHIIWQLQHSHKVKALTRSSLHRSRWYCWRGILARCRFVAAWMTGSNWVAANAAVCSGSSTSLRTIALKSAMGSIARYGKSVSQGNFICSKGR